MEGFFYHNSDDAYQGAWAVLQDRYGSPFVVQRAFRDKLMKWPKISANDPTESLPIFFKDVLRLFPMLKDSPS